MSRRASKPFNGIAENGISEQEDGPKHVRAGSVAVPADDPTAPSMQVSSVRQRLSDFFTIFAAGFALISDGYQVCSTSYSPTLGGKSSVCEPKLIIILGG